MKNKFGEKVKELTKKLLDDVVRVAGASLQNRVTQVADAGRELIVIEQPGRRPVWLSRPRTSWR